MKKTAISRVDSRLQATCQIGRIYRSGKKIIEQIYGFTISKCLVKPFRRGLLTARRPTIKIRPKNQVCRSFHRGPFALEFSSRVNIQWLRFVGLLPEGRGSRKDGIGRNV